MSLRRRWEVAAHLTVRTPKRLIGRKVYGGNEYTETHVVSRHWTKNAADKARDAMNVVNYRAWRRQRTEDGLAGLPLRDFGEIQYFVREKDLTTAR